MRKDIAFDSMGLNCRGWLYLPDGVQGESKLPVIVMAHGFSAVKEQILPEIAERFANADFAVVVFDYRFFGASEGEPRCQLFPLEMVEDYRNAITWACQQPNIDPSRVGIWGTSYSGGLVAYTARVDRRVKAVVAQAPSVMNAEARRAVDPEKYESVGQFLIQNRIARYETGAVNYMAVVAPEGEPCILPGQECYDAFMELKEVAPNWRNEITVESLEKIREFDPVSLIHMVSPTALLIIAAERDSLIPIDALKQSFDRAVDPKKMTVLPIEHFEIYRDPWLSKATGNAVDWFREHLF
jgi:fermentation-respiration switch protein FrsA (DUF1100 family)